MISKNPEENNNFYSSNPKIALEQVVSTYKNWIEANLGGCEAPYKGIKQRKHLVST